MAPIEIECYGQKPDVVEPGWDIGGIVTHKLLDDHRLRMRFYCLKTDQGGGAEVEVLKVRPRFKLGPIGIFEKRETVERLESNVKKGESRVIQFLVNGVPTPPITIRHKQKR